MTAPFAHKLHDDIIGDPAHLALKRLTHNDLAILAPMLREDAVAAEYGDADEGLAEIASHIDSAYVSPFLIVSAGRPVGYLQVYCANDEEFWTAFGVPEFTFGLDMFLGAEADRNRGTGPAALRLACDRLLQWPEIVRLQIDPSPENAGAVRAYAKVGFAPRGVFPGYDGDTMLYMTLDR